MDSMDLDAEYCGLEDITSEIEPVTDVSVNDSEELLDISPVATLQPSSINDAETNDREAYLDPTEDQYDQQRGVGTGNAENSSDFSNQVPNTNEIASWSSISPATARNPSFVNMENAHNCGNLSYGFQTTGRTYQFFPHNCQWTVQNSIDARVNDMSENMVQQPSQQLWQVAPSGQRHCDFLTTDGYGYLISENGQPVRQTEDFHIVPSGQLHADYTTSYQNLPVRMCTEDTEDTHMLYISGSRFIN